MGRKAQIYRTRDDLADAWETMCDQRRIYIYWRWPDKPGIIRCTLYSSNLYTYQKHAECLGRFTQAIPLDDFIYELEDYL